MTSPKCKKITEVKSPTVSPAELERDQRRIATFAERSQRKPPKVNVNHTDKQRTLLFDDSLDSRAALMEAMGSPDKDLISKSLMQLINANPNRTKDEGEANALLATLHGIHPQDELEGLLATQMVGVHNLAMEFMSRAVIANQTVEGVDANVNRVTKLLRTFTQQLDALNRYRNKGQQQVNVQHVQVNGGQAIVGTIQHQAGGGGINGKK